MGVDNDNEEILHTHQISKTLVSSLGADYCHTQNTLFCGGIKFIQEINQRISRSTDTTSNNRKGYYVKK